MSGVVTFLVLVALVVSVVWQSVELKAERRKRIAAERRLSISRTCRTALQSRYLMTRIAYEKLEKMYEAVLRDRTA